MSASGRSSYSASSSAGPSFAGPSSSASSRSRTTYLDFRKHVPCYCLPNWPRECPGHNEGCSHSYWAHTPAQTHNGYVAAAPFCTGCQSYCYSSGHSRSSSTTSSSASRPRRSDYLPATPPPSPAAPRNTRQGTALAQHHAEHAYHIFVHRFKLLCNKARERRDMERTRDRSQSFDQQELRLITLGETRRAETLLPPSWVSIDEESQTPSPAPVMGRADLQRRWTL